MKHNSSASAAAALSGGADAGDAVMARWLQSAGLQHLASPLNSADQRLLPNLLMQGYGTQSAKEKQRVFRFLRKLNFNGETGSEPYTPTSQSFGAVGAADGFYSPDLRGEGAGLLDLHSVDDTELLSEHVMSEPFEPSPFMPDRGFDNDFDLISGRQQEPADSNLRAAANEKESSAKESNVAKIKFVVRKRPLNKKEVSRKEDDIVTVHNSAYLSVHEPKLKIGHHHSANLEDALRDLKSLKATTTVITQAQR